MKKVIITCTIIILLAVAFFCSENIPEIPETDVLSTTALQEPSSEDTAENPIDSPVKEQSLSIEEIVIDIPQVPVETSKQEEEKITPSSPSCMLSVRCDSVLSNLDMLTNGKAEIIPDNGIIFSEQSVTFSEGESVFDILLRELKNNNVHLEFVETPMYNSVYIEGIGNLYEFDCGSFSGWLYKVNGVQPTYGCSQYIVQNGDKIELIYSCNLFER
ncbi:MAG: DUF4430 domain-containing protein [Clostridia bacterium]|nr:DUF4430 domain-containing protein [Clostridia bacterium]